jgi:putative ABC transport system permease protein
VLRLAVAQVRARPSAFVAVAATALLAVTTITLFSLLIAADAATPASVRTGGSAGDTGLGTIARVFGEGAMLVSLLVMLNCLGFAVRQQLPDLALLRTLAATPRQVHRLVRWQALVVVAAVTPAGWLAGSLGSGWFLRALQDHGYAVPGIEIPATPLPHLIALVAAAGLGVLAAAVGVRRVNRLSPAAALGDTTVERRRLGWVRWLLGIAALGDAAALLGVNVASGGEDAVDGAFLALLVLMAALGLLAPAVAAAAARVLGVVPRRLVPREGWLADANVRGHSRRLAAAVIPVALLVGLAGNFLFVGPTMDRATAPDRPDLRGFADPDENWLRLVELAMFVGLTAVAVVNTLVATTASRRSELRLLRLLGATRDELWRVLVAEAALVALVGLALGGAVATVTLATFSLGATGSPLPSVPMAPFAAIVVATGAIVASGILVPARRLLAEPAGAPS